MLNTIDKNSILPEQMPSPQAELIDTENLSAIEEERLSEIISDPIVLKISPQERKDAVKDAFELYIKSKDVLAPVIACYVDSLLHQAGTDKQLVFAARDGLGLYLSALALIKKFPNEYVTTNEQIAYAYFTRKLMMSATQYELREYVVQLGLVAEAPTIVTDIGMYGSIQYALSTVFSDVSLSYLISRNPSIPGFIDDGNTKRLNSLKRISGNPAIHFLEDTFSGRTSSPDKLERVAGVLVPNIIEDAYEPKELLKRTYAVKAFTDHVAELKSVPQITKMNDASAKLDDFLKDVDNYRHLMVPHIG